MTRFRCVKIIHIKTVRISSFPSEGKALSSLSHSSQIIPVVMASSSVSSSTSTPPGTQVTFDCSNRLLGYTHIPTCVFKGRYVLGLENPGPFAGSTGFNGEFIAISTSDFTCRARVFVYVTAVLFGK